MRRIIQRARSCILLLIGTLLAANVWAQDIIWIGRPSVRDYLAANVQRAFQSYAELRQQSAELEAQIAEARRVYFSGPASSRAVAGEKFGQLLFQKDLYFASPRLIATDGQQAELGSLILALGNGGRPIDGGIAPSAAQAFSAWVSAVRRAGGNINTMASDPQKARDAILGSDSQKEYQIYRRLRDQAEFDDWEAISGGKPRRLNKPGQSISARSYFGETPFAARFDYEVQKLDTKILRCEYAGRQAEGSVFDFWRGEPPANIAYLLALNPSGLAQLQDHAVDECPSDDKQARVIASAPTNAVVSPEMARRAHVERNSVPRDPAEIRANQAEVDEARQRMNDRNQSFNDQKDKFRACMEEFKTTSALERAARIAPRDSAARVRYNECMRVAREHIDANNVETTRVVPTDSATLTDSDKRPPAAPTNVRLQGVNDQRAKLMSCQRELQAAQALERAAGIAPVNSLARVKYNDCVREARG